MVKKSKIIPDKIPEGLTGLTEAFRLTPNLNLALKNLPRLSAHVMAIYIQRKILLEQGKQELVKVKDLVPGATEAQAIAQSKRLEFEAKDPEEQRLYERAYLGIDLPSVNQPISSDVSSTTGIAHGIAQTVGATRPTRVKPKEISQLYTKTVVSEDILENSKIFKESIPVSSFEMVSKIFANTIAIELLFSGSEMNTVIAGLILGGNLGSSTLGNASIFTSLYDMLTLASSTAGAVGQGISKASEVASSIADSELVNQIEDFVKDGIGYKDGKYVKHKTHVNQWII